MYAHLLSATPAEQKPVNEQVLLSVQVEFGIPDDNNCVKFGICRTTIKEKAPLAAKPPERSSCRSAPALLSQPTEASLLFQFPGHLIRPCTRRVFFSAGLFVMEAPYILTDMLVVALFLSPGRYWIPAGGFQIHTDQALISLYLPLLKQKEPY